MDSGADLNAYAKLENQAGCCSPAMGAGNGLNVISEPCCTTETPATLHEDLTELLAKYDVNAAPASVTVYAVKPAAATPCCGPTCCPPAK